MNTENDIKNLNKKKKFLNLPQKLLRVLKSDNNTLQSKLPFKIHTRDD